MITDINPLSSQQTRTSTKPKGYHAAREVKTRAAVTRANDNPQQRKAVLRLNRVLDANRPLSKDVPRGFYLNIQV